MRFSASLVLLSLAGSGLARSVPKQLAARQDPSSTADAPPAQSTICGAIIDDVNDGYNVFWASDAYACLSSVPFNPAVATRFVKYWNETIQFQSTLAYLKNPPTGYQQPAFDVIGALGVIQQRINEGFYTNQYSFEADFQLMAYAMHDSHVALSAGALSAFSFASPYELSSVSIDGKQAPKVYLTDDVIDSQAEGWEPSPLKTINGEDVVDFLTKYAKLNSWGYVEPHADWNALMAHPAMDIQAHLTTFSGGGTFYPGENLTFTFENGTNEINTIWLAIYNEEANATGPLTTGGDFYNYFVLGLLPESFDPTDIQTPSFPIDQGPPETNWSVPSWGAYPEKADVYQYDLAVTGGGLVTGYFFDDISTGVLSIPSFDAVSSTIGNFSNTIAYFIGNATEANITRVVIDLQQNFGGATLLAYTTFKSFFPDLIPYGGSRRRSFDMANELGASISDYWGLLSDEDEDDLAFKQEISANEWVILNKLNADTGNNFTSWEEYQGPVSDNGDFFTLTEQYDLANPTFDAAAFDQWIPLKYLGDQSRFSAEDRPWSPDQIVILTDGLCSSACSLLVEMMTRVGVRTVVAGGRPTSGPMQAASGNRGARVYYTDELDDDILLARGVDEYVPGDTNGTVPEVRDSGIFTNWATINLRDQIRQGEKTPLQFKYEAADCRIYYTLKNLYNMTRLWHDAAAAAWDDPSLCVEGSTGFSTTNNTTPKDPPKLETQPPVLTTPSTQQFEFESDPDGGLQDILGKPRGGKDFALCTPQLTCTDGISVCRSVDIQCSSTKTITQNVCLPPCTNRDPCKGTCYILQKFESKSNSNAGSASFGGALYSGLCYPLVGTKSLGCPAKPKKSGLKTSST